MLVKEILDIILIFYNKNSFNFFFSLECPSILRGKRNQFLRRTILSFALINFEKIVKIHMQIFTLLNFHHYNIKTILIILINNFVTLPKNGYKTENIFHSKNVVKEKISNKTFFDIQKEKVDFHS